MPATKAKSSDVRTDPRKFRAGLVIDAAGRRVRLERAMDSWQRADFEALDGGLQVAAGVPPTYPVNRRAWCERPRGHSKTTDFCVMAAWLLIAGTRPLKGYWAAVDREQAALAINAFRVLVALNPGLRAVLEVNKATVTNKQTGSTLEIISSDVASSWGLLGDFIFCDEVTHWSETAGKELFGSLFSTAAKRESCLFVVITNAGFADGWQEKVALAAQDSSGWYYSRLDGPKASWITPETLEEQRKFLPPATYNRVWLNIWSTAAGDALDPEDVRACVRPSLRLPELRSPYRGLVSGELWASQLAIVAIDIGIKRDHTAVQGVITDFDQQRIHHFYSASWAPPIGGKVDLAEVEAAIEQLAFEVPRCNFIADPWQAEGLIQRLNHKGYRIKEFPSTPKNLSNWATSLVAAFVNRQVTLIPNDDLVEQLLKLRIVENPAGFKLQAPRDRIHGHCDKAIAFSMALGEAMTFMTAQHPWVDDGIQEVLDAAMSEYGADYLRNYLSH